MRPWVRYLICAILGVLFGATGGAWSVRNGTLGSPRPIGSWTTGGDFALPQASAHTRAIVALHGLLALPASEARYYNASVDELGRPLVGRCRYRVEGHGLPARWWSLTLYDATGYLVANRQGIYSIGSAGLPSDEQARWTVMVGPGEQPGHWLPTGNVGRFELTLRAYLPDDGGAGYFTRDQLPVIVREACA